jgi:type IV pilus assembly protein PilM
MSRHPYRRRRVVGLDLGATGIKAAQVLHTTDGWLVEKKHYLPLPDGVIYDGRVLPTGAHRLTETLRRLWSEAGFKTKAVVLGLGSSSSVFMREIAVRRVDPRDADKALPVMLAAKDPSLDAADVELSWRVIAEHSSPGESEGEGTLEVSVCSARRDFLQDLSAPVKEAGLNVVGGDLTALAILRATKTVDRPADQIDALIDIGESVTTILLHDNGVPRLLTLDPDSAGRDATERVLVGLGLDAQDYAEAVIEKNTPSATDGPVARAKAAYGKRLANRIRGGLDAYLERTEYEVIAKVVLTGGGSRIDGLGYFLHDALGSVPMDRADLAEEITFSSGCESGFEIPETGGEYLAAIGLGMATRL